MILAKVGDKKQTKRHSIAERMFWLRGREASHIDIVHEKRHMDVLLETPPLIETSRTFFDIYLADFKIECIKV